MENETPVTQPNLGYPKQLYRDFVQVMTEPRAFLTFRYPQLTFTYALVFGVIVNWIAATIEWVTRMARHETIMDSFNQMRAQLQSLPFLKNVPADIWNQNQAATNFFPAWIGELFSVALSPFQSILHFILRSLVFLLGAYILVPRVSTMPAVNANEGFTPFTRDRVDLNHVMKLVAFSSAPNILGAILGFLPFGLNNAVAWIYTVVFLCLGFSIRYRVSGLRAFGILIIPSFFLGIFFACALGLVFALIFGGLAALMGGFH